MTAPDDLVERQKQLSNQLPQGFYDQVWCSTIYAWSCQAAAEFTRLRERVDSMGKDGDQMAADLLREYQRAERAEARVSELEQQLELRDGEIGSLALHIQQLKAENALLNPVMVPFERLAKWIKRAELAEARVKKLEVENAEERQMLSAAIAESRISSNRAERAEAAAAELERRHMQMVIDLEKAEADRDALRADAERLDYVERAKDPVWRAVSATNDCPTCATPLHRDYNRWTTESISDESYPTVRAAIDAARGEGMK